MASGRVLISISGVELIMSYLNNGCFPGFVVGVHHLIWFFTANKIFLNVNVQNTWTGETYTVETKIERRTLMHLTCSGSLYPHQVRQKCLYMVLPYQPSHFFFSSFFFSWYIRFFCVLNCLKQAQLVLIRLHFQVWVENAFLKMEFAHILSILVTLH